MNARSPSKQDRTPMEAITKAAIQALLRLPPAQRTEIAMRLYAEIIQIDAEEAPAQRAA